MYWLSPFCYMAAKFGPLQKKSIKKTDMKRDDIFQQYSRAQISWRQKEWRSFNRPETRTSWRETKNIQIKLATTCNKNGQHQDA